MEISATLTGNEKERFLRIQEAKGLKAQEVFQLLIDEYFEKELAKEKHIYDTYVQTKRKAARRESFERRETTKDRSSAQGDTQKARTDRREGG